MADFDTYPADGNFLQKLHHITIVLPIVHVIIPTILCGFILKHMVSEFVKNRSKSHSKKRNRHNISKSFYIDD